MKKRLLKLKKFKKFFLAGILVLLLATLLFYFKREGRIYIDDAFAQAPVISLSAPAPGILKEIDVAEGDRAVKGQALAIVGTQILRAETAGLVIATDREVGSIATPQTPVVQLINPDDFRIIGTIDENKGLKDIKVGQVASFSVDAYPGKTYWGWVDEISPTARATQLAFSISSERPTRQFNIYVRFDNFQHPEIKNGMSAKLTIYVKTI